VQFKLKFLEVGVEELPLLLGLLKHLFEFTDFVLVFLGLFCKLLF
jgi:hypothetical protein